MKQVLQLCLCEASHYSEHHFLVCRQWPLCASIKSGSENEAEVVKTSSAPPTPAASLHTNKGMRALPSNSFFKYTYANSDWLVIIIITTIIIIIIKLYFTNNKTKRMHKGYYYTKKKGYYCHVDMYSQDFGQILQPKRPLTQQENRYRLDSRWRRCRRWESHRIFLGLWESSCRFITRSPHSSVRGTFFWGEWSSLKLQPITELLGRFWTQWSQYYPWCSMDQPRAARSGRSSQAVWRRLVCRRTD